MPGPSSHSRALQHSVATAPETPGVYRWMDVQGQILYIGKAKNLRKRLRSYVGKARNEGPWKQALRASIADVDITVTDSELEALVLETNLIQEHHPKYNVLMRDGKNYLYIRITTNDAFPTVDTPRRVEKDGAAYFGPYLTKETVEHILALLHELYPFRACHASLERGNRTGSPQRTRPCLEYQIGRCCGLCAGMMTKEEYRENIENVLAFLRGNHEGARRALHERMQSAAGERKFERAATLRNFLAVLESTPRNGVLVSDTSGEDSDIIGIAMEGEHAHVVVLRRRHGRIVDDIYVPLTGSAESPAQVLEQFLPQYYAEGREIPPTILLPTDIDGREALAVWLRERRKGAVYILCPERGRKSRLLQIAEKNAAEKARRSRQEWEEQEKNTTAALKELQSLLRLPSPPRRIEGYDISHLSGTETVGSMVVFCDGKSANGQYRSFVIRTLKEGAIDDYAALREVLTRRLRYLSGKRKGTRKTWKAHSLLQQRTGKKTYVILHPAQEHFFADIGFRHVLKAPQGLTKKMQRLLTKNPQVRSLIVMVMDTLQQKPDRSLVSMPDLLVIDGGKGQLSAATDVLQKTQLIIPVVALAKREEELFVPGAPEALSLSKDSTALFLLMRLRDEAHRFANRHRVRRVHRHLHS